MTKVIYFLGLLFLGSACASLNKAVVNDPDRRAGLQELHLSAGYDVYKLRVDLIRTMNTYSDGNNNTQQLPTPYHYLGVNLGNGLFYDANRNLTLNLTQLPELAHLDDFTIRERSRGSWNRIATYQRQADQFTKEKSGLFSPRPKAHFGDSTIVVDEGGLSSKNTIQVKANGLQSGNGLFATTLEEHPNSVVLKRLLNKEEYRQQGDKITLDRRLLVENKGAVIEIAFSRGLFRPTYYFIKVDNSYYFFDKRHRGVKVTIQGREVLVEINGREQAIYMVENLN